jgi:mRNA interferase MazF
MDKFPKRGEVYWVSLDPTIGSEVQKTRPGLILSNDLSNKHSQRVIIGPITSSIDKLYPFEAKLALPKGLSKVMLDQIRAIDKRRLGIRISLISIEEMHEVEKALKLTLALS